MKNKPSAKDIIIRYAILVIVAVPNLWLFYKIFTPLTVYPVKWLLGLFFNASLISSNIIILNLSIPIEIIPSCVAGAAYYLLLMLNLFTPGIKLKQRTYMILSAFGIFLVVNILRIFILAALLFSNFSGFDVTHKVLWYGMSTLFVVGIWFYQVKKFRVRQIPLYSDIKSLYKISRKK